MSRHARGQMAYHSGEAAEHSIAQDYERRGFSIAKRRWRGPGGEIDLITRNADGVVFVEVKKGPTLARAAERIRQHQMARIYASAAQFLENEPQGQLTNVRFDVALVDGQGQYEILENAYGLG
ncbi:YraN family protein [Rhodobacteraceae bacterium M382]|nr:YraN family protein [Rhodobacteraceae bacterium M382]